MSTTTSFGRFDELLRHTAGCAPTHRLVTVDEIEPSAAFLASDAARPITGQVVYIDGGYNVID